MANLQKRKSSLGETLATKGCGLSVANGLMYGMLHTDKTIFYILAIDWFGSFFTAETLDDLDDRPMAIKKVVGEKKLYPNTRHEDELNVKPINESESVSQNGQERNR